jgi:hypothetical protein
VNITEYQGVWGGETAAAKYTDYLKPQVATVYLPDEGKGKFIRDMRLRKGENTDGAVLLFRQFWNTGEAVEEQNRIGLAHPVLVYADLVATADTRNLEVAGKLFDDYLAKYCWED